MVSEAINGPTTLKPVISKWVWYQNAVAGVGEAILEGQAVCFNFDYGTATDSDARRVNHVEKPTFMNAQWFAGVAARAYSANNNGGRFIEIYTPGSVCLVHLNASAPSTVVGQGLLTFDLTSGVEGQFLRTGMPGAGSVVPLESTTSGTAQKCLALLQEGPQSGGVEYVEPTDIATWVAELIGGTTQVKGLALSQDCVEEIVDGLVEGIKKRIVVVTAAFTGNQLQVDIENDDGVKIDSVSALAEVTFNTVGDNTTLEWKQGAWHNLGGFFTAEA